MSPRLALVCLLSVGSLLAQAHWTRLYPAQSPSTRNQHALAFHEASGFTILFGGWPQASSANTWLFDGSNWSHAQVVSPPQRTSHAMVYDVARAVVVMFGGSGGGDLQDTWEWNGTSWALRLPLSSPPGRHSHSMAYDRGRQRTILFSGDGNGLLGDTWEWDGQIWAQKSPGVSPAPRASATMAFDPTLGGVLLFGGGGVPEYDETWRWDGQVWQQQSPPNLPFGRGGAGMVADLARRRVVLWGGYGNDPFAWEWDGATWHLQLMASPTPRANLAMAYDGARRQVIMFAGGSNSPWQDTWIYRTDDPATFETIGAGCPGTAGTAELTNAPYTLPWIGDTFATVVSPTPANAAMFFATGFEAPSPTALDPFGLPGCTVYLNVLETLLTFASPAGEANWALSIPNSPALAGVELAQQALILDPPANAAGAVMSSAGRFTVGIR